MGLQYKKKIGYNWTHIADNRPEEKWEIFEKTEHDDGHNDYLPIGFAKNN